MRIASTVLVLALLGGCAESRLRAQFIHESKDRETAEIETRAKAHALSLYLNGMVPHS